MKTLFSFFLLLGSLSVMSQMVCDLSLNGITVVNESNCGNNDASITLTATTSNGPITYSISGPVNQSNATGVFINLPPGTYAFTISDDAFVQQPCASTGGPIEVGTDCQVPTLSQWGIILLLLSILIIGSLMLKFKTSHKSIFKVN